MAKYYLSRGDKGIPVKFLQTNLKTLGYNIVVDGSFGPATEKVVKQFQKDNKLIVDGYAGPQTQKKILDLLLTKGIFNIMLDPGHGAGKAYNRGALYYNEGDNNFNYALVLKEELETYQGVVVNLTRNKITDNPDLAERSLMGHGHHLFLSLHSNGYKDSNVRGTEVYDSIEKPNKKLAAELCKNIAATFAHPNRGVKYKKNSVGKNWYGVLRDNQAQSAMIIEHGFHTNPEDCKFFLNNHKAIAKITAETIAKYYGLKKKVIEQPKSSNDNDGSLYKVQAGAYKNRENAEKLVQELKNKGFDAFIKKE